MGFFDGASATAVDMNGLLENTNINTLDNISSIMESTLICISETEENWNNIMKACAYNELSHYQHEGTEYLFTEATGVGFIESARAFFNKIWMKIQSVFKKFLVMIGSFTKSDKDFVNTYKADIGLAVKNIPADAKFKGYKFDTSAMGEWVSCIDKAKTEFVSTIENSKSLQGESYDKDDKIEEMRGKISGANINQTAGEFNTYLFEQFRSGSSAKEDIDLTSNLVKECMNELVAHTNATKQAKDAYAKLSVYFSKIEAALKKEQVIIAKKFASEDSDSTNELVGLQRAIDLNRSAANVLQTGNGIYLTAIKDYSRQCKAICVKTVMFRKQKEPKHEGYSFNYYEGANFLESVVLK